jgi:hypothetical protein
MPALTPVPAADRPRVWAQPELASHARLVLTPDLLRLTPPGPDPADAAIDLAAIRRARLDLLANTMTVEAAGTAPVVVVFATPEAADACFTRLWRWLGDGFKLLPYRRDSWALARTPLLVQVAVLAVTAVLAVLAGVAEDFAAERAAGAVSVGGLAPAPVEVLFGWLSWKVVCGLGGVAAAVSQVWLYRRLTQPPASLELVRG